MEKKHRANSLVNESSPYLLQHAYNPVDWMPWNNAAWEKARNYNKLVVVSIGYSACHWCHVMEHESFEDIEVAALMNEFFVSIKVDREERPDIDNVYMEAVQLMTGQGGWPLNCICLPDGRPIYGGTYFRKSDWMNVLNNIQNIFDTNPEKVLEYAHNLYNGLHESEKIKLSTGEKAVNVDLDSIISRFTSTFDTVYGGPRRAPKFPMPCNLEFLLNYGILHSHKDVLEHVRLTLTKMAYGGINDQIGGGFARYSVDELWKIPHFEKMLYDNGQLVGLYAKAFAHYHDELFNQTVVKTIAFMNSELKSESGLYYSALDADSEGVEGKFYIWNENELQSILTHDEYLAVKEYYSINDYGYWEHNNYVLIRRDNEHVVAAKLNFNTDQLMALIRSADDKMMSHRSQRIRPGLDDKCLLAWNALALKGIAEAAVYLQNDEYFRIAVDLYKSIQKNFKTDKGWQRNYKNGNATIMAFAEDLALLAEALIKMYEMTFDELYLTDALALGDVLKRDYFDEKNQIFYFTSRHQPELIIRKVELFDNVIPSPNSVLSIVYYQLGTIIGNQEYIDLALHMVQHTAGYFENAPQALANWLSAYLMMFDKPTEIVITGENCIKAANELRKNYLPLTVWCASETEKDWPLLTSRLIKGQTTIYKCKNKACNLPIIFNA